MHLGAHAVDLTRLYATQRILGVIGVFWAMLAGLFLVLGGARRLISPAWQPLLDLAHSRPPCRSMSATRWSAASCSSAACWASSVSRFTRRHLSLASTVVCTVWCATVAGFLGMSNVNVVNGGNFVALSVAFNGLTYLVRFFLLIVEPQPGRAVRLYDRG
jgi:hypothetical protein